MRALQETQAWIVSGSIVESVMVVAPPTLPQPALSDGESKVAMSDGELPVSKVQQSDEVEHTLDRGLWVGTRAMQQGWKIFVKVSRSIRESAKLLIPWFHGQLMERVPTCQRCQELHHECYGLPDRVCSHCQCDKKTCQDVVVEGESVL